MRGPETTRTREAGEAAALGPERGSPGGTGSLHRLHWVVIGLSLALTASAWWYSRGLLADRVEAHFQREAEQLVELVTERMSRYEDALQAGVAAIDAHGGEIDRMSWRDFATSLRIDKRYPGVNGIGVIRHVPAERLEELIARETESYPEFEVHPEVDAADHYPIVYIEPEWRNRRAIGLDMAHERNRLEGLLRALHSGEAQITAPIVLVQDSERTPGFLFFAPHRSSTGSPQDGPLASSSDPTRSPAHPFDGAVYAPFIVRRLMAGTLALERRQVSVAISDDGETIHDELDPSRPGYDPDPLFAREVTVPLYGRQWSFDIRSNLAFREAVSQHQPLFVLIGGILIDLMLIGLFLGMSRANRALARVAEVSDDLRRKTEALTKTNRELERFACVVSHDLKTPLRGIGDLVWYLEEDLEPYLSSADAPPEIAHNIGRLHAQVRRMNGLIEGILEYSAAGTERIRIERIDTREVFEEIAELHGLAQGQLLLVGDMPVLETCRARFEQVMNNIVGNAFKYHHDRARAITTVSVAPAGEHYRFSIADDGPGIDPRFHEKIFEMFQTLQPQDAVESTGIGLSIVRKCAERMGGSVTIESTPGNGTTFHVDWPRVAKGYDTVIVDETRERRAPPRRAA